MSFSIERHYTAISLNNASTDSLFNTIKFMYNNLAPSHLSIDRESLRFPLSAQQQVKALKALVKELATRDDITPDMWRELAIMNENCKRFGGGFLIEN